MRAWPVALALLASLGPSVGAEGPAQVLQDADASLAYVIQSSGSIGPLAGLPQGPGTAPPVAQAAQSPPGSAEQGRQLRPAGSAAAWWLAAVADHADGRQRAAEEDGAAARATWLGWAGSQARDGAGFAGPGGVPGAPDASPSGLPRPGALAQAWLRGPRVASLETDPPLSHASNRDPALRISAQLDSPGGVAAAWAVLATAAGERVEPMAREPDGRWTATFQGPLAAGEHALRVEALDAQLGRPAQLPGFAGAAWPLGWGRSEPVPFRVADAVPPTMRLVPERDFTSQGILALRVEARDEVAVEALRLDAGDGFGPWGPVAGVVEVPLPRDGVYTFTVEARDAAGNTAGASAQAARDSEAPAVALDGAGDHWHRGPVTLRLLAGPSLAPASVHASLDGSDPRGAPALQGEGLEVSGPGEVLVRAVARDLAGNVGPEAQAWARIDASPPELALDPGALEGWLRSPPRLRVLARDDLSGVGEVRAGLRGPQGTLPVDPAGFEVPGGVHAVAAEARDLAGNRAALEQAVRVDATPPSIALDAEPRPEGFLVRWGARDAGSGVAGVELVARVRGGEWGPLAEGGAEGAAELRLAPGEAREVRARARDLAGNVQEEEARFARAALPAQGEEPLSARAASPTPSEPTAATGGAQEEEPRLEALGLPDGRVRVRLVGAPGLLRDAGPARVTPWGPGELLLEAPGAHRIEALAGELLLVAEVQVGGAGQVQEPGGARSGEETPGPAAPPLTGQKNPVRGGRTVPAEAGVLALALAAWARRRR